MALQYTLRRVLYIVIICLLHHTSYSQLTASFTSNTVSGCTPVLVHFTDQSTGNPTQWRWELGNGTISFLQNPSTTYFNPGTYNVKLVIRNADGADSIIKQQYITVYPNPVVNFTASDTTGCFPLPVQFTDLSTTSSGTITTWNWDFGDGSLSNQQNPSHTYTGPGSFTVTLRVTNSHGCSRAISKMQYIKINNGVTAGFTNTSPSACTAPVTIQFTNTSGGNNPITYQWDFGDGSSSTQVNPAHTYTSNGTYTVTLIAVSASGCSDTITKTNLIAVGGLHAAFSVPDSICQHEPVTITNTSTPLPPQSHWTFGDGSTSTEINPVKMYPFPGTYIIKLVNQYAGCADSVSRPIVVKLQPVPDFSADQVRSCKVPFTVTFSNLTPGNNTYRWNFGDGGTSMSANPVHTYTTPGTYTVSLIAINENGCSDTIIKSQYIQIQEPVISIRNLPRSGCVPLTIAPTATVTANQPIATYTWDFGDGSTSNQQNPTHTYTTAGTFDVSLIIETTGGCRDTLVLPRAVRTGNKPDAAFTLNPPDVCAFQPVQFTDNSTGDIDQWHWQFGDGGASTAQHPVYAYQDTGYFDVTLIVWSNTCPDTIRIQDAVHIRPPIASFSINRDCDDKYTVNFTDKSIGATGWSWEFGDGTTSTQQSPSHMYATPGTYQVTLTVTNGTCIHRTSQTIRVIDEKADFIASSTVVCKGSPVLFTAINANAGNIQQWRWNFGDGDSASNALSTSHTYDSTGVYTISLIIKDALGCPDTATLSITVYGPTAAFSIIQPSFCLGGPPVLFTDESTTDGIHNLVKWIWNYGDGTIDSLSPAPYTHFYGNVGSYNVSLTVADENGCRDTITKPAAIIISKPRADFYSPDTATCTDKPVRFINSSSGNELQYRWDFGDGQTSTTTNPEHSYLNTGIYTVSLVVTDQYGCQDSLIRPLYVSISIPKARFNVSDTFSTCPPLLVDFTNESLNYIAVRWDFGDGNTSTLSNPSHFYTEAGIYYPKLVVTGPGGCMDSTTRRIEIRGPRGSFTYEALRGCVALTVRFTAITSGNTSITWDFNDGNTLSTTDSIVTHTYLWAGEFIPKMILHDANGCSVAIVGKDTIRAIDVLVNFGVDKFQFCDSGYTRFYDATISNDLITNWRWDFGDGNYSNSQNPIHHYTVPGIYPVSLVVTTETGCSDSLLLPDTIKVYARPSIAILGDSAACIPARLDLSGQVISENSSLLAWQWDMGNGTSIQYQDPPPQTYSIPGDYIVTAIVTDENSCRDTAMKTLHAYPLPVTNAGPDQLICAESSAQLNASGASTYQWDASADLSCTGCADPVVTPSNNTLYAVTGIDQHGCTDRDSVFIKVQQRFNLLVSPGDTICAGESVQLAAAGAHLYTWSPAGGLNNASIASPRASPSASTVYHVTGTDSAHCFIDTASVIITVYPIPEVETGPDVTIAVGSGIQLNATASGDVTSWNWAPGTGLSCTTCPGPVASPRQTTRYRVDVKNMGGCPANDYLTINVVCGSGNMYIPNTFSPNGDGINDRFYPRGRGLYTIRMLRIFNRWGEIVFEKFNFNPNDASMGWDGRYKGQVLSPDVFVYTCDIICENNEVLTVKGDITLLQ